MSNNNNDNHVISYLTLRKTLGFLGILLPFILVIGNAIFVNVINDIAETGEVFRSSISHYYYTKMGNVFVGTLCAYSLFLFSYVGYKDKDGVMRDKIATNIAAVFALGVAFLPTDECTCCGSSIRGTIHLVSAVLFFGALIYISYALFTKTGDRENMSDEKKRRNKWYKGCAVVMFLCLVLMGVYVFADLCHTNLSKANPIFVLESIALIAFGTSWLIKGEFLLGDK